MEAVRFMLDSSVCIPVLRRRAELNGLPAPSASALSAIVAAELWSGIEKRPREDAHRARLAGLLELFPVLDFDHDAALHYASIRADLERKGTPIGPLDLLIAAHSRSVGATLVTANAREFQRVEGLQVLAWQ